MTCSMALTADQVLPLPPLPPIPPCKLTIHSCLEPSPFSLSPTAPQAAGALTFIGALGPIVTSTSAATFKDAAVCPSTTAVITSVYGSTTDAGDAIASLGVRCGSAYSLALKAVGQVEAVSDGIQGRTCPNVSNFDSQPVYWHTCLGVSKPVYVVVLGCGDAVNESCAATQKTTEPNFALLWGLSATGGSCCPTFQLRSA